MESDFLPKWAKEINRFLSVKQQFVLWGNIYDVYPIEFNNCITTLKIGDYLKVLLGKIGYKVLLGYEPLSGFYIINGDPEVVKKITGVSIPSTPGEYYKCTLIKSIKIIKHLINNNDQYAGIVLNFASRFSDIAGNDLGEFYYEMFRLSHSASPRMIGDAEFSRFNLLIWTLDKENDIPDWYTLENPKIKSLSIPKPDYDIRRQVIGSLCKYLEKYDSECSEKRKDILNLFIDQTSGLLATEIVSIVSLAKREKLPFTKIGEAIRRYKLGIIENPWSKLDLERISNAESILTRRVKGQSHAVKKVSDIIKRAVYNLSGAQYSKYSQRPKGVLFFAGPTGVGKTELAKTVTELVFGTETSYIRFDMSEFSREHSDQRLIGAPPGYVGYDMGGELTNAVKQNPFSVILFDEIEKAHPRILDMFLQILDDGRLTSGRGETVYFSESLIIFTSNLGIYEMTSDGEKRQKVNQNMPLSMIVEVIKTAVEDFFKYQIGRPEILNRIGDNIVVFDFIRLETAFKIFEKMIGMVFEKLKNDFKVEISINSESLEIFKTACCDNLSMGGREVGNRLENILINPLSRALFLNESKPDEKYTIVDVIEKDQSWEIILQTPSV
ncbi:ATP-dependent Clp protease ATP-binding subunit [bacterium]|nr:ATP-dependent Clp protease ATP-binding subunit [bacterium]